MVNLIARLRVLLHDAHEEGEIGGDAFHALAICAEANLPQLLDSLEALERVAEAAKHLNAAFSGYVEARSDVAKLRDALAALEVKGSD